MGYVPIISDILQQCFISFGYVDDGSTVGGWVSLVGSGFVYLIIYRIYTSRLEKLKNLADTQKNTSF
jgi:hypothetical protein